MKARFNFDGIGRMCIESEPFFAKDKYEQDVSVTKQC